METAKTITRGTLAELLKTGPVLATIDGYHTNEKITDVIYSVLNDYGNPDDEISDSDGIKDKTIDSLYEAADNNTPVYTSDLMEWLKGNYTAVDDYVNEIGDANAIIKEGGITRLIIAAYCYTLENEARDGLEALLSLAE